MIHAQIRQCDGCRELAAEISRLHAVNRRLCRRVVTLEHELGGTATVERPDIELLGETMADIEREAIRRALAKVNGNRGAAAALLDISERTIYRKIRQYELEHCG